MIKNTIKKIENNVLNIASNINNIDKRVNTNYRFKNVSGYNDDVLTTDYVISPRNGHQNYTLDNCSPPIGDNMYIYSTSNDDSISSTGARTVRVKYIDKNNVTQTEDLNMNAATHVPLSGSIRELLEFYVLTSRPSEYKLHIL